MKNPIYLLAYSAGYYKTKILAAMKIILALVSALTLVYFAMHRLDLTIEIKRSGDILWLLK
jgi:hypothetical protein